MIDVWRWRSGRKCVGRNEGHFFCSALATSFFLIVGVTFGYGQPADEKRALLQEVSRVLFANDQPEVDLEGQKGALVVMLAPPGTSLAALTEGYNGVTADVSQAWAGTSVFDRPVQRLNGYAVLAQRNIEAIWSDLLASHVPPVVAPSKKMTRSAAERWLFACTGKSKLRVPSRYLNSYRRYEELVRVLVAGKDSGLWKLHPSLKKYVSFESALTGLNKDWLRLGYKDEIESAMKILDTERNTAAWQLWLKIKNSFETYRTPIDASRWVPQTIILPPPGTWSNTTAWARATATSLSGQKINFQLARIQIIRPWLEIESLLEGKEFFDFPAETAENSVLSDGVRPTASTFPSGELAGFIQELILVRQVSVVPTSISADLTAHPLLSFAYPEAVNLLGYVVRTLPKLPQ